MSLAATIAGAELQTEWDKYPASKTLRDAFISALFTSTGGITSQQVGEAVMAFGGLTEAYNLNDGLHPDVKLRQEALAARNSLQEMKTRFTAWNYLSGALNELRRLGAPDPHIKYLEVFLYNPVPLYSLSGVASVITLTAILLGAQPAQNVVV